MSDTPAVTRERAFTHQALLYGSDDQFLTTALAFARSGLAGAEPVFVATTARNTSLLRKELGAQARQVEFAPAGRVFTTPAQTLLGFRDRASATPGHARVLSETFGSPRARAQSTEWTRYEALLNLALATSRAWFLCPYDTRHLSPALLHSAEVTHPYLITGNGHSSDLDTGTVRNAAYTDPRTVSAACDTRPWQRRPANAADFPFHRTDQLAALRRFAAHHARQLGLADDQIHALLVCVVEAATNALQHGAGHGTCRIWDTDTDTELLCDITDPAGRIDPALAGYLPPHAGQPEGRGLWIIRQLADAVDIHITGRTTTIRLHFTLHGPAARTQTPADTASAPAQSGHPAPLPRLRPRHELDHATDTSRADLA
jgi:anti-sigma regulatory factor (Ser/Thr protein kinase)